MLIIENGQMAGQRWLMDSDCVIIGREASVSHLLLPERQVSRKHAKIERTDAGFFLSDLGSKNGTFLNGKEVHEPQKLQDGDEIQIALSVKIAFVGSDATAPLNARPISQGMPSCVASAWTRRAGACTSPRRTWTRRCQCSSTVCWRC